MNVYNGKAKIETQAKEDSVQKMFEEFAIFWNELSDFKSSSNPIEELLFFCEKTGEKKGKVSAGD